MNSNDTKELLLKLLDDVSDLKVTSAKQEENLKAHMKRSDTLEMQMDLINKEVRPILEGFSFLKKLGKFAVGLATILKAISLFWKH